MTVHLEKIDEVRFRVPKTGGMRTDGVVYTTENMIQKVIQEKAAEQVANMACLPGIVGSSMAMPDVHWGYGFPIGGVAATSVKEGVISPGGVGFDVSCGIRLLKTNLLLKDFETQQEKLVDALFQSVPSGIGSTGRIHLSKREMHKVFEQGAKWAVSNGYGESEDLETCEDGGFLDTADPDAPSDKAVLRGKDQLGTLGSGNHFLEIQRVEEIFDQAAANVFGLFLGQAVVMLHTGSRGCGYQICEDFVRLMQSASQKYGFSLPDRQLCCAPFLSPEGQKYFGAMSSAANYARANRQVMTHWVRESFMHVLGMSPNDLGMGVVYDVCHNIAKLEEHEVKGKREKLVVHRKGATRSFPAGHSEVPDVYQSVGQPVLLPGTMGTGSYVCVGTAQAMKQTFGTTCHGAGRVLSRKAAMKQVNGRDLQAQLKHKGILVRSVSYKGLAEEAPQAYKDVDDVVAVCESAGLSKRVARLVPWAVVKG